jgi:hypothetical protein
VRRPTSPARRGSARTSCSARTPAASSSPGRAKALDRLAERIPLDVFGTVGGDALVVDDEAGLRWTLDELRTARASLAPLFP